LKKIKNKNEIFCTQKYQAGIKEICKHNQNPEAQVWATTQLNATHNGVHAQRCEIQIQMCAPVRTVRPEAKKRRTARV